MIGQYLDFERPIVELENKLEQLKSSDDYGSKAVVEEIKKLERKIGKIKKEIFSNLSRWQKTLLARHPSRPYMLDYVKLICKNFIEIHGDRAFMDDAAIVTGFAEIDGQKVVLIGQQKGRTTHEKLHRNFGMAHPEGYRKALRVMKLAEKFHLPIISFVDTPGAYPGLEAEERGQAEAIAKNLIKMAGLAAPIIVAVIGEGGSGGALAIGIGDIVMMMEYAIYSVISPEGCASILWKDAGKGEIAADIMKITAPDLKSFDIVDVIVPEPEGGAHRDPEEAANLLKEHLLAALQEVNSLSIEELLERRYEKYRKMGENKSQTK
ncbi:MAG: acetyl-CoA carboxylase carboxyltransferase subunit alpha [Deltaproteobacteria bacterium]|nr:acetyl-CoA carboxylase carboxyltransferase subunit alpha [Deltaproteobacteria bacterium]